MFRIGLAQATITEKKIYRIYRVYISIYIYIYIIDAVIILYICIYNMYQLMSIIYIFNLLL